MNRNIAVLAGLALMLGAGTVLAHGGGHSGGSRGGSHGGARAVGVAHTAPVVGVRPPVFTGRPPVFVGRPPIFTGRPPVFVGPPFPHRHHGGGGTVVVAAPFYGYPYYPYPYYYPPYPPTYPAPVYEDPPTYIEQGADIHYYCADSRGYYPDVPTCASPWVQVLPDGRIVSP